MKRMSKKDRERADAVYLAQLQEALPLDERPQTATLPHHDRAPLACPSCDKLMGGGSGWTLVFGDILQCGGCGYRCTVPRAEYEAIGAAIHRYFNSQTLNQPRPAAHPKRGRGAR